MSHNLILPFIIQEVGVKVNDVLRIYTDFEELTNETHCIVANVTQNWVVLPMVSVEKTVLRPLTIPPTNVIPVEYLRATNSLNFPIQ